MVLPSGPQVATVATLPRVSCTWACWRFFGNLTAPILMGGPVSRLRRGDANKIWACQVSREGPPHKRRLGTYVVPRAGCGTLGASWAVGLGQIHKIAMLSPLFFPNGQVFLSCLGRGESMGSAQCIA